MSRKALVSMCLFASIFSLGPQSNAQQAMLITLNFDELNPGVYLTDQYRSEGVVFSGTSEPTFGVAGVIATPGTAGTVSFGNSEPNFVIVGLGSLTASFIDPVTGGPTQASYVSFRVGDGESNPEIVGVNAFDPSGTVIFSQVIHLIDKGTTVEIRSPIGGISQVRLFGLYPPIASGFNMDDFKFMRSLKAAKQ